MNNKIYSMLGICMKAGMLTAGSDVCEENLKAKTIKLLIIAEDASEKTKEKFQKICEKCGVTSLFFGSMEQLSSSIGKNHKAIIGIKDDGFAKQILKLVKEMKGANS